MLIKDGRPSATGDIHVDAIGNTLLVACSGSLDGARLDELIARNERSSRAVVLDLAAVEEIDDATLAILRSSWRKLGSRLRVVAPPGSEATAALRRADLRRFAVHSTLSGALAQAGS